MYILFAFAIFCIFYSTMAITLCRTLKPSKQADTRQNVTHCRACNVLLIEHNHGCRLEDLQRVPIQAVKAETQINIKEDLSMLKEYVATDTSTLSEIEQRLLLDYFRYREVVNELKSNYPELAKQYIIDDKPKRTRKVKAASEPTQETIEDWLQDSFPSLKTGRNKLGGGTCRLSLKNVTAKMVERMDAEYTAIYGITEREMLVSKCPKCNGHFKTTFERDNSELEEDEENKGRMIRKQVTRFTCDDCGHTLIDSCGKYLVNADYDAVANDIALAETQSRYDRPYVPEPVHDMSEEQIDEIESEPVDELCYCDKCEQNFEESEMDHGNCPFCGSRIADLESKSQCPDYQSIIEKEENKNLVEVALPYKCHLPQKGAVCLRSGRSAHERGASFLYLQPLGEV